MPLLLVKREFKGPFHEIIATVDATSEHTQDMQLNGEIIRMAQSLCSEQARPHLLHAWSLYGASVLKEHMRSEEYADAVQKTELHAKLCLEELVTKYELGDAKEIVHLLQGDPIDVIPTFVAEHPADLLVMGTVGRSGLAGLLMGNTAEQILERVSCSVLAVKPTGFESPVRADG
jgi:nucleotide-binding universal stress UspA family protein